MKKTIKILFMLALAVIFTAALPIVSLASEEENAPSLTIHSNNVSYSDSLHLAYAVSCENFDMEQYDINMLFWTSPVSSYTLGTQDYTKAAASVYDVNGVKSTVIYSAGIAAKDIPDVIYSRAYADVDGVVVYSDVIKYSVLHYVYERLDGGSSSSDQISLYNALLDYGAAAQRVLEHDTKRLANDDFYEINVSGGTLSDGFTHGLYVEGETITLTCLIPEGQIFSHWEDENGNVVGTDQNLRFQISAGDKTYSPVFSNTDFTVTFKDDEGRILKTQTVKKGASATAPQVSDKTCLKFTGWDKSFENITEDTVITTIFVENHTFVNNKCTGCGLLKETPTSYFDFKELSDGTYSLSLKTNYEPEIVVIPETYNDIPITEIGANAFMGNTTVKTVILSKNVKTIAYAAFQSCSALTEIVFPDGSQLTSIGNTSFAKSAITSISIPEGVTTIDNSAFNGCASLTSVTLPTTLEKIGYLAFLNCKALQTLTFADPDNWWYSANADLSSPIEFTDFSNIVPRIIVRSDLGNKYFFKKA